MGREEASFLAYGKPRELAHEITLFIRDNGPNNIDKNIDITPEGDGYKVKGWSSQAFITHDCWATIHIIPNSGNLVKIRMIHCGDLHSFWDKLYQRFAK